MSVGHCSCDPFLVLFCFSFVYWSEFDWVLNGSPGWGRLIATAEYCPADRDRGTRHPVSLVFSAGMWSPGSVEEERNKRIWLNLLLISLKYAVAISWQHGWNLTAAMKPWAEGGCSCLAWLHSLGRGSVTGESSSSLEHPRRGLGGSWQFWLVCVFSTRSQTSCLLFFRPSVSLFK